jgi:hypothetical protein
MIEFLKQNFLPLGYILSRWACVAYPCLHTIWGLGGVWLRSLMKSSHSVSTFTGVWLERLKSTEAKQFHETPSNAERSD